MATYTFRCPTCGDQDHPFAMGTAPDALDCTQGHGTMRRIVGAPRLSLGDGAARRLLDATVSTAERPAVVTDPPRGKARQRVTSNPLHQKLPRP